MGYYKRQNIANIVNGLSANYPCSVYDFDLKQCYDDIFNYCKLHKKRPANIKCDIKNNFLYIDNIKVNKVVFKIPYNNFASLPRENEIDYEGLILARQEKYFD